MTPGVLRAAVAPAEFKLVLAPQTRAAVGVPRPERASVPRPEGGSVPGPEDGRLPWRSERVLTERASGAA